MSGWLDLARPCARSLIVRLNVEALRPHSGQAREIEHDGHIAGPQELDRFCRKCVSNRVYCRRCLFRILFSLSTARSQSSCSSRTSSLSGSDSEPLLLINPSDSPGQTTCMSVVNSSVNCCCRALTLCSAYVRRWLRWLSAPERRGRDAETDLVSLTLWCGLVVEVTSRIASDRRSLKTVDGKVFRSRREPPRASSRTESDCWLAMRDSQYEHIFAIFPLRPEVFDACTVSFSCFPEVVVEPTCTSWDGGTFSSPTAPSSFSDLPRGRILIASSRAPCKLNA